VSGELRQTCESARAQKKKEKQWKQTKLTLSIARTRQQVLRLARQVVCTGHTLLRRGQRLTAHSLRENKQTKTKKSKTTAVSSGTERTNGGVAHETPVHC
jgi:hypothetical protein